MHGDLDVLVTAALGGLATLGGVMAAFSGLRAASGLAARMPDAELASEVNRGLGEGFILGAPAGLIVLFLVQGRVIEL